LVLHELATNAIKYGALSRDVGVVQVTWNLAQDGRGLRYLNLLWQETGGPPVTRPTRTGFGTRMISRSFREQSGGKAVIEFPTEGVRCVVELPLTTPDESKFLDVARAVEDPGGH
jgi:two-component sensor histidine kinase